MSKNSNMKTAVTQIKERLLEIGFTGVEDFFNEYLETEKQQLLFFYDSGVSATVSAEQFYEQTFNNQ